MKLYRVETYHPRLVILRLAIDNFVCYSFVQSSIVLVYNPEESDMSLFSKIYL